MQGRDMNVNMGQQGNREIGQIWVLLISTRSYVCGTVRQEQQWENQSSNAKIGEHVFGAAT